MLFFCDNVKTEFSGIVYHANYLRFMERGRTNHLRLMGAEPAMGLRTFMIAMTVALFAIPGLATAQNPSSEKDKVPLNLDYYRVQCGILSREGLSKGTTSRLTRASDCQLTITDSDADVTTLNFTGKIDNQKITWSFEGDAKSNVFKQLAPQTGGKFIRGR